MVAVVAGMTGGQVGYACVAKAPWILALAPARAWKLELRIVDSRYPGLRIRNPHWLTRSVEDSPRDRDAHAHARVYLRIQHELMLDI